MRELVLGLGIAALAAAALTVAPMSGAEPITPSEWGMDDGRGVGPRVAGTPCLAMESHQWAKPADGGGRALWCPPPAFIWVSV